MPDRPPFDRDDNRGWDILGQPLTEDAEYFRAVVGIATVIYAQRTGRNPSRQAMHAHAIRAINEHLDRPIDQRIFPEGENIRVPFGRILEMWNRLWSSRALGLMRGRGGKSAQIAEESVQLAREGGGVYIAGPDGTMRVFKDGSATEI